MSSPTSIDLRRFCTECVPDFAPLGGSRPDVAVVGCAAMSAYEGGLPRGVILPPDVLDTALAALCAPLVISSVSDLQGREAHEWVADVRCALSVCPRATASADDRCRCVGAAAVNGG